MLAVPLTLNRVALWFAGSAETTSTPWSPIARVLSWIVLALSSWRVAPATDTELKTPLEVSLPA